MAPLGLLFLTLRNAGKNNSALFSVFSSDLTFAHSRGLGEPCKGCLQ